MDPYWRGDTRLRERIEDELRPPGQPKVKHKNEVPAPDAVLNEVTAFVKLARDGAYMAGDRRVHHTERSKWRLTFRRLAGDALTALQTDTCLESHSAAEYRHRPGSDYGNAEHDLPLALAGGMQPPADEKKARLRLRGRVQSDTAT